MISTIGDLGFDAYERLGPVLKCTPPVRSREAVEGMWKRVLNGSIDMIGSDHSPSTLAQKNPDGGNFFDAWGGVQGVQTMLPALFSEGTKRGLSIEKLVSLVSTEPARIFGLYPSKGVLRVGSDADLTVFDPEAHWTLSPKDLQYKNLHTPYIGMSFQGRVAMTISRGRIAFNLEL